MKPRKCIQSGKSDAWLILGILFSFYSPNIAFNPLSRNELNGRYHQNTLYPWRIMRKYRSISLPALTSFDESDNIGQPNVLDEDSDLNPKQTRDSILMSLYQKVMEKAGTVDDSRYTFPEISSGKVPTLFR